MTPQDAKKIRDLLQKKFTPPAPVIPPEPPKSTKKASVTIKGGNTEVHAEKGEKGDTGPMGPQGIQGPEGPEGPRGEPGKTNILTGPRGIQGEPGKVGARGETGKTGKPGRDGSPDSAMGIAVKLNTLSGVIKPEVINGYTSKEDIFKELKDPKSKFRLEPKDIKGMPLNMNDLRWHGGGLSVVSHDTTLSGDGTPTSPLSIVESGLGTVTNFVFTNGTGITGTVLTSTTTPTLSLALTTAGVSASTNKNYVTDAQAVIIGNTSGTNTGDQTSVSGNAGTATALQSARTIAGVSFNGTANIAIASTNLSDTTSIVLLTSTQTLTNKRITKRVVTVTQSATPTINTDNTDVVYITGLAQAVTSFTSNLTGTPVNGDALIMDITDNGTGRSLTFGASFESSTVTLPTTTVASTKLTIGFRWNIATNKWTCVAVA